MAVSGRAIAVDRQERIDVAQTANTGSAATPPTQFMHQGNQRCRHVIQQLQSVSERGENRSIRIVRLMKEARGRRGLLERFFPRGAWVYVARLNESEAAKAKQGCPIRLPYDNS